MRSHPRGSPGTSWNTDTAKAAFIFGHRRALVADRWNLGWRVPLESLAGSFFKSSLFFCIGFWMTRARHELAPTVTIQQAIDATSMHLMLHLSLKSLLNFLSSGNLAPFGSSEKEVEKAAFLFQGHIFMTTSTLAWGFNRSKSQAVVGGNDAAHRRDRHACISGNLFSFARDNQGMVNDPPAFSNPRAWIQLHATFHFFKWNMSSGSCDSRSQFSSSSLSTSVPSIISLGTRVGMRGSHFILRPDGQHLL